MGVNEIVKAILDKDENNVLDTVISEHYENDYPIDEDGNLSAKPTYGCGSFGVAFLYKRKSGSDKEFYCFRIWTKQSLIDAPTKLKQRISYVCSALKNRKL